MSDADVEERDNSSAACVVPLLLTAIEAAHMLSVGRTTVYELIAAGDVETVRIGRCMRIPADSVHALVARRRRRR